MKEFIIEENEAGQRFDKYLAKLLREDRTCRSCDKEPLQNHIH